MRESAYRESNGADSGGQPCGAALQGLLYHSNTNTCLVRFVTPPIDWQFSTYQACAECALPLDAFPHSRCRG